MVLILPPTLHWHLWLSSKSIFLFFVCPLCLTVLPRSFKTCRPDVDPGLRLYFTTVLAFNQSMFTQLKIHIRNILVNEIVQQVARRTPTHCLSMSFSHHITSIFLPNCIASTFTELALTQEDVEQVGWVRYSLSDSRMRFLIHVFFVFIRLTRYFILSQSDRQSSQQ